MGALGKEKADDSDAGNLAWRLARCQRTRPAMTDARTWERSTARSGKSRWAISRVTHGTLARATRRGIRPLASARSREDPPGAGARSRARGHAPRAHAARRAGGGGGRARGP